MGSAPGWAPPGLSETQSPTATKGGGGKGFLILGATRLNFFPGAVLASFLSGAILAGFFRGAGFGFLANAGFACFFFGADRFSFFSGLALRAAFFVATGHPW